MIRPLGIRVRKELFIRDGFSRCFWYPADSRYGALYRDARAWDRCGKGGWLYGGDECAYSLQQTLDQEQIVDCWSKYDPA